MSQQRFKAMPVRKGKGAEVELPFDPNHEWGTRDRFYITGTVAGCKVRGPLQEEGGVYKLSFGPAWVRDNPLPENEEVEVVLSLEGPQADTLAPDIAAALDQSPEAKAFFTSLATFYRKGYIDWIESAKRPETRSNRISETVRLLNDRQRQR